jgi:DNA-binding NarL/FixJ family response regulator
VPSSGHSVLIVARAAAFREGLEALLAAIPSVNAVCVAEDLGAAISLARALEPRLVLMDAETLGDRLGGFLDAAAANPRPLACIVLVENEAQELAGLASGAGEVVWKGLSAEQLLARVRARLDLLPG